MQPSASGLLHDIDSALVYISKTHAQLRSQLQLASGSERRNASVWYIVVDPFRVDVDVDDDPFRERHDHIDISLWV